MYECSSGCLVRQQSSKVPVVSERWLLSQGQRGGGNHVDAADQRLMDCIGIATENVEGDPCEGWERICTVPTFGPKPKHMVSPFKSHFKCPWRHL